MIRSEIFPGHPKYFSNVAVFVKAAAKDAGLSDKGIYAVELAVDEAVSNVYEHSYKKEVGEIECICEIGADGLTVTLLDTGIGFDPLLVPEFDTTVPLMQRKSGGAGWFIIRKSMDSVHYSSDPKLGNSLTLHKNK